MTILALRTSIPRESTYVAVRQVCLVVLVSSIFVGYELLSVEAAVQPIPQRALNRVSVAATLQPIASSSLTDSRDVHDLSAAAAAGVITNDTKSSGTVDDFSVTASAEQIALSYGASRALHHEWSVAAASPPIVRSAKSSRAVNELSAAASQPIVKSSKSSRAATKLSAAVPQPTVRRSTGSIRSVANTAADRPIVRRSRGSRASDESSLAAAAQSVARSKKGSSTAVEELSTAAVQPIARSNLDSRAGKLYNSLVGIPTIGKFGPTKATAAWQLPKGPIKKVLVIFEDINVQPYEFWDRSPECQQCTGLPEKRKIVIDAIARNYAVLIPHPLDIDGMWEAPDSVWKAFSPNSPDILNILYIIAEWKSVIDLQDYVPTVALGVSSGAETVSTLGLLPGYFESIGMMVSSGLGESFQSSTRDYPPTIFIHMPKDTATAEMVSYDRNLLSANGVPSMEVMWYEHCVTEYWFAMLIPGLDQATSSKIYRHLRELQWLDETTGFLKPDSDFQNKWFDKVREWNLVPTDFTEEERLIFEERVFEELNVAYGYHATLARNNNDLFAWFEGGYEMQKRSVTNPSPDSLSTAASNSPLPPSVSKVSSHSPASVSLFKAASY